MATASGDGLEAASRGPLRASHADRDQVIETLKVAFVQGRLTKDELDARAGQAFAARTYAELAALTADIPGSPAPAARRPPAPARRRPLARAAAKSGVCLVVAFGAVQLISLAAPGPTTPGSIPRALAVPLFIVLFSAVNAALVILVSAVDTSLEQRHSRRQLPPGRAPGAGGPSSRRLPPADPGRQLPPGESGHWHTADAAPMARPRLQPS